MNTTSTPEEKKGPAILFKFKQFTNNEDGNESLHHEICKTIDEWTTMEPFLIFEELQTFLRSNFIHVHQFSKMIISDGYEISSRVVHQIGNVKLALKNHEIDWTQFIDRRVNVHVDPLFMDFQLQQDKDLHRTYFCGGTLFSVQELLEMTEDNILKACLENDDDQRKDYLCYYLNSKISGQIVKVKLCQPYLSFCGSMTEFKSFIRWIIVNEFKISSSSLSQEKNILVKGRYELLNRIDKNLGISNNPLINTEITSVWLGKDYKSKRKVVIKIGMHTADEAEFLQKIDHPNIIKITKFYPSTESIENSFIIFPFGGTDLLTFQANHELSISKIRQIISKIVDAVIFLHNQGISHRDIKLQNILYDVDQVYLADFDGSSTFASSKRVSTNGFTKNLNDPPEMTSSNTPVTKECDIWAIGVVMYQLLTKDFMTSPVEDFLKTNSSVMEQNLKKIQIAYTSEQLDDLIDLIKGCIQYEKDRINLQELKERLKSEVVSDDIEIEDYLAQSESDEEEDFETDYEIMKQNLDSQEFTEFVKCSLQGNGINLQYCKLFSGNEEMVTIAVKSNPKAIIFASDSLQTDVNFMYNLIMAVPKCVQYLNEIILKNEIFMRKVIELCNTLDNSFKNVILSNKRFVCQAIEFDCEIFHSSSEELKSDKELYLLAIRKGLQNYLLYWCRFFDASIIILHEKYADELKSNRDLLLDTVKKNGYALVLASIDFKSDREIVLESIKQNAEAFIFGDEKFRSEKEFVLEAVKQNEYALKYALDREFVLEAVKQNGNALKNTSYKFKLDREIVLEAVKQNGNALKYASDEFKSDREFVLEAVKQNGNALKYASDKFKSDREIVLEAVKQNGYDLRYALEYLSDEFKSNREFVLEVVKRNGLALKYASDEFKSNREFVLEAVKQNGNALKYASDEFKSDREFVLEAVKQNVFSIEYASDEFKSDREIVLEVVKQNGLALKYASDKLKSDREIVLEAVKQNGNALKYALDEFELNREIVLEAVKQNGLALDRKFVLEVVKRNGLALKYASDEFKSDREIVLEAVKQNGNALKYASDKLKSDREFVLEAIKHNARNTSVKFKSDRE